MRKYLCGVASILAFSSGCGGAGHPTPTTSNAPAATAAEGDDAWARLLGALPGAWSARTERGAVVRESFRLISNDSALVEDFVTGSGKATMSVYHRDGAALMLTHYCAQRNQPRLRAARAEGDAIVFRFLDATSVGSGQSVLVEKRLRFQGAALEQTEIYRDEGGALETTVLHFERAGSPAP